jgi:hypothetical protein
MISFSILRFKLEILPSVIFKEVLSAYLAHDSRLQLYEA